MVFLYIISSLFFVLYLTCKTVKKNHSFFYFVCVAVELEHAVTQ